MKTNNGNVFLTHQIYKLCQLRQNNNLVHRLKNSLGGTFFFFFFWDLGEPKSLEGPSIFYSVPSFPSVDGIPYKKNVLLHILFFNSCNTSVSQSVIHETLVNLLSYLYTY